MLSPGCRWRQLVAKKSASAKSFIPTVIAILNRSTKVCACTSNKLVEGGDSVSKQMGVWRQEALYVNCESLYLQKHLQVITKLQLTISVRRETNSGRVSASRVDGV